MSDHKRDDGIKRRDFINGMMNSLHQCFPILHAAFGIRHDIADMRGRLFHHAGKATV